MQRGHPEWSAGVDGRAIFEQDLADLRVRFLATVDRQEEQRRVLRSKRPWLPRFFPLAQQRPCFLRVSVCNRRDKLCA